MLFSAGTATNSMKDQQIFKDKLLQSMMLWVFVNYLVYRFFFFFPKIPQLKTLFFFEYAR